MTTEHILGMEPENVARQMIRNYLSLNTRKSVLPESCVSLMMEFNEWLVSTNETYQKLVLDKINTSLPSPMVIERPNSPAISDLAELEGIISELRAQLDRANAAYVSQSDLQSHLQAAEQRLRKFESLEAHLPPGFAIGDNATAALAIKLVEAEQRVGELRQLVTDLHDFTKGFSGRKVDVLNRRAEKALAAKAK